MAGVNGDGSRENPASQIKTPDLLSDELRAKCRKFADESSIKLVVESDLLHSGRYGTSIFILTENEIISVEDDKEYARVKIEDLATAYCREFVGNGILEARTNDERRIEIIRFSRTLGDAFNEVADHINKLLNVDEDSLEENQESVARVSGPKEEKPTYRCPNCGYPLKFASDACPKCTNKRQVIFRLLTYLKGHLDLVALGIIFSLLVTVCTLGQPQLLQRLVDRSLNPVDPDIDMATRRQWLWMLVGLFFLLIGMRMVGQYFRIRVLGALGEKIVTELRQNIYRALQRLSLSYFDREHTGRIMARVLNDTRGVQRFIVQGMQQLSINILLVIGIMILLFAENWLLALIALAPVPIVVMVGRYFSNKFQSIFRTVRRRFANLSASVSESISGVRVVKSFAQEDREIIGFEQLNMNCFAANMQRVRTSAKFTPSIIFMMGMGTIVVWFIGGRMVLDDTLTLGVLMKFIAYMNMFYNPVQQLLALTESFQDSATAAERIFSIMDMPSDVSDHDDTVVPENIEGRMIFDNVSFSYDTTDRVLKNINLTIEPGQMIGLVGQTGSGKSTLVSLVCRFYDPSRGKITLDGTDLRDIQLKALRSNIGMVLQETFLFAGTIRENLSYGRPDATDRDIIEAAKAANAHDFIMNLPDGYDSEVGERGVNLSGGEKQRIAIARAILRDPAILILDEATSAVDTATEVSIQEAMDRLVKGRTTLAIAHRLSTLRNADKLLVLDQGEIIEQGTHEELMVADGAYANLCKIQSNFLQEVGDSA